MVVIDAGVLLVGERVVEGDALIDVGVAMPLAGAGRVFRATAVAEAVGRIKDEHAIDQVTRAGLHHAANVHAGSLRLVRWDRRGAARDADDEALVLRHIGEELGAGGSVIPRPHGVGRQRGRAQVNPVSAVVNLRRPRVNRRRLGKRAAGPSGFRSAGDSLGIGLINAGILASLGRVPARKLRINLAVGGGKKE